MSRIVHDHKGTAIVQWYDAPVAYDRPVLEIEGAGAGALPIPSDDSHHMQLPDADRKRAPGQRTDLRKLSAWIKLVRELEEAKKRKQDDAEEED